MNFASFADDIVKWGSNIGSKFIKTFGSASDDLAKGASKVAKVADGDAALRNWARTSDTREVVVDSAGQYRRKGRFVSKVEGNKYEKARYEARRVMEDAGFTDIDDMSPAEMRRKHKLWKSGLEGNMEHVSKDKMGRYRIKNSVDGNDKAIGSQWISESDVRDMSRGDRSRYDALNNARAQVGEYKKNSVAEVTSNFGINTPTTYVKTGVADIDEAAEEAIRIKQNLQKTPVGHLMGNREGLWKTPGYHMTQARMDGKKMSLGEAWSKSITDFLKGDHLLELDPDVDIMDTLLKNGKVKRGKREVFNTRLSDVTRTIDRKRVWGSRAAWGGAALAVGGQAFTVESIKGYRESMNSYGNTSLIGSPAVGPDPQMALDAHSERAAY